MIEQNIKNIKQTVNGTDPASAVNALVKQTNSEKPFLLSVYDYTGNWAKPYINNGWKVQLWDKQIEGDILERFTTLQLMIEDETGGKIDGLLAAPPCTAFAGSGARWWPDKDTYDSQYFPFNSFTEYMVSLTLIVLHMVDVFKPMFWAMENPVGRIERLVPELKKYDKLTFQPNEFGDPYTKRTIIYGNFNTMLPKKPVEATEGSRMWKLPPGPNRANLRSATPDGFAKAFYQANNQNSIYSKQLDMQFA